LIITGFVSAQITVKGTITDSSTGESLPGVNVTVKGTTTGTVTNLDGSYSIKVPSSSAVLSYSYVGYKAQEKEVSSNSVIDVTLEPDFATLDEVVVIGYGQVKKSDATGSVATVSSKDFNKGAITSPQDLMVGKSAGVVITSSNGAPGSGSQIRIRGGSSLNASNDPLIVIDGVPMDNAGISGMANPLSTINPNDIESFTVLKDASATAIYGSRASNGVIIITTKRGQSDQSMKISYNGNTSVSSVSTVEKVLSGDELRDLAVQLKGTNNIDNAAITRLGRENTDWQKEIYRVAFSQDHNLSISGSTLKTPYRVSVGYTDQNGVLKNTDMQRYTAAVGVDPTFFDKSLKVNMNAKGSISKNNFGESGAVGSAVAYDPTQTIHNGNKRYAGYTQWTLDGQPDGEYNQMANTNPVSQIDLTDNKSTVYRGVGNLQLDYTFPFLPELRANLNMGMDAYKSDGYNNSDTTATFTRRAGYGRRLDYSQQGYNKLLDFYLNYVKKIDAIASKIDITGGYSYQKFHREGDNYDRSIVTPTHALITADSSNYATESVLVSFFGRMNYTLMNRYLITATVREDGSSRFSKDNHWGLFPSVALAWKVNEESFLKDVNSVSELKLRLGWGQTGQQNISSNDFPYLGTYRVSQQSAYYQFGNKWYPTLRPSAYDPNIKWETTTTQNVGIDFGFFNDRISGSFDVYQRTTDDLLNNIAIPNGSNFSNYLTTNVGSLENKGYEVTLNVRPIATKDMGWNIGFNLSYNENKITKLLRTNDPTYIGIQTGGINGGTGNNIQINSVGYSTNSFFVLQQVYDVNGNPVEGTYVDRSGKGGNVAGNLDNFYRYKKSAPDYTMGISSRFNYKNFDASFSGRINLGNYVYNNTASGTFYGNLYNNSFWRNLSSSIKDTKFNNAQYFSDYYIENASFFRMDNISVGYNFDKIFTDKLKGRLSFTVQNAFVITKYKGLDPEVDNGIDNNLYPRPRTFLLGLNLDL
jgi:iron complex outermembrane receptor protein